MTSSTPRPPPPPGSAPLPEQLVNGADAQIEALLRDASRQYAEGLDEGAAFRRLSLALERGDPRSAWRPSRWGMLALALAALAALLLAPRLREPPPSEPVTERASSLQPEHELAAALEVPAAPAVDAAVSAPTPVRISERATPLAAGQRSTFPDGTVAALGASSIAEVASVKRTTRVVLERGHIELSVARQPKGSAFEVESGAYRFEVLGTVFRVEASSSRVSLEVKEGKVAVWRGQRLVEHVEAGQRWKSEAEGESAASEASVERRAKPEVDCLGLARDGQARQAEQCFLERAAGTGLAAELSLYEAARLRVDVLGDAPGALAALREHAERFPSGSLRHEADVFRVELLARLGRAREALRGTDALLASASGQSRAAELYVLRGNVYRQSLEDPAAAEREYARAEGLGGAAGAQATYLRASCFEALEQPLAAIESYRRYLSVPGRPHAKRAQARLQQLERRSSSTLEKVNTP